MGLNDEEVLKSREKYGTNEIVKFFKTIYFYFRRSNHKNFINRSSY